MSEINEVSKSIGMLEERTENLEKTIVLQHAVLNEKMDRLLGSMTKTTMSVSKAHNRLDALTGPDGPIAALKEDAKDYKITKARGLALIGIAAGSCGGLISRGFEFMFAGLHGP